MAETGTFCVVLDVMARALDPSVSSDHLCDWQEATSASSGRLGEVKAIPDHSMRSDSRTGSESDVYGRKRETEQVSSLAVALLRIDEERVELVFGCNPRQVNVIVGVESGSC